MKPATFLRMVWSGELFALLRLIRAVLPVYRVYFLAGAARGGVLGLLAKGPVSIDSLAAELEVDSKGRGALASWLEFGRRLGEIRKQRGGYSLRSRFARTIAHPRNDPMLAAIEETVGPQLDFIVDLLPRLRERKMFSLQDYDHALVARSSRLFESFVFEAVDAVIPSTSPCRILDVGCGSGIHTKRAADRHRSLEALCIDQSPEAVDAARRNINTWGLAGRVRVEQADVMKLSPRAEFNVVMLHNNIYYFPLDRRVRLLEHLRAFLRPEGKLLVTTGCQGGSAGMQFLDLWACATEGCGPLPATSEVVKQMEVAGFGRVVARKLTPGERFYSFVGTAPSA